MKVSYLLRILFILNALFFCWGPVPSVQAKSIQPIPKNSEAESTCTALDLAFVIDQSKEMSRIDPDQIRINAIHWMIDVLGYDRLMQCPDTVHRVTVISFSGTISSDPAMQVSEISVDLDISPINPDPTKADPWSDWATVHQSIVSSVKPQKLHERNFQSLYDAINEAADKLIDAPDIGTGKREKAIILMIGGNGAPCTTDQKCAYYAVPYYQRQLIDLFQKKLQSNISFWTLLYGTEISPSNPFDFPEFWETVSDPFGGKVFDLGDANLDTARTLMKIYQNLSPRPGLKEVCGSTYIDPIVEKAAFSIYSENPQSRIIFTSQVGSEINSTPQAGINQLLYSTNTDSGPSNVLDYVFKNPTPGMWQFDAACSNQQALVYMQVSRAKEMQLLSPQEKLAQYKEPGKLFDITDLNYLQVQVVDAQKQPIPSPLGFDAVGTGEVDVPGQSAYPLTFHYENGIYTSNEALPVSVAGDIPWKADFTFAPADPQSDSEAQVIHLEGKYTVAVRKPFVLKLEKPTGGQQFTVHGAMLSDYWMEAKPFDVQVRVAPRDAGDTIENMKLPFTDDLNAKIKVTLINTKTNHFEEVWLEQSKDDPFLFKGQVGSTLEEEGEYAVVASFTGSYDTDNYRYVQTEVSTNVQRFDIWSTKPENYKAVAGVISTIILALLLLFLYQITNPVSGYLIFSAPIPDQPPFATINLQKFGRRRVILEQQALLKESLLLANLETVVVKKNRPFGGKHVISVSERDILVPIICELENPQNGQRLLVGDTSKGYKIEYSATPPDDSRRDGR